MNWQWIKLAASPSGLSIPVSTDGLRLSWTLPDAGFTLQFNPGLAPAAWTDLSLPNILTLDSSKMAHVTRLALPNAAGGFFRMMKRQ